jgi:hypothetical protein
MVSHREIYPTVRRVWLVVPLVLIGIIGMQESFAEETKELSDFQIYVLSDQYGEFYLPYKITGGNLTQINPSGHDSLEIHLETSKDGFLILSLPRKYVDTPEEEQKFTVLDSREYAFIELEYDENSTETNRVLTIPFTLDTEKIEILHRIWLKSLFTYDTSDYDYLYSPLKQIKNGIKSKGIECRDNLELILKLSNTMPICVTSETAQKLFERGLVIDVTLTFPYQTNRITQTNQTEWIELPTMRYSDAWLNVKLHKQLLMDYYKQNNMSILDIRYNLVQSNLYGEACEGSYGIFSVEILVSKSDLNKLKNMDLKSYFQEADACNHNFNR